MYSLGDYRYMILGVCAVGVAYGQAFDHDIKGANDRFVFQYSAQDFTVTGSTSQGNATLYMLGPTQSPGQLPTIGITTAPVETTVQKVLAVAKAQALRFGSGIEFEPVEDTDNPCVKKLSFKGSKGEPNESTFVIWAAAYPDAYAIILWGDLSKPTNPKSSELFNQFMKGLSFSPCGI